MTTRTCACADKTGRPGALYRLIAEELVCIECGRGHGPRHGPAARDRLASGGRLYLTEEELNPVPAADAGTVKNLTEAERQRQRRLAGLSDPPPPAAELSEEQKRERRLAGDLEPAPAPGWALNPQQILERRLSGLPILSEHEAAGPRSVREGPELLEGQQPVASCWGEGAIKWAAIEDLLYEGVTSHPSISGWIAPVVQAVEQQLNGDGTHDLTTLAFYQNAVLVALDGATLLVPFTMNAIGSVSLGDARPVEAQLVPAAASAAEEERRPGGDGLTEERVKARERVLAGLST